MQSDSAPCHALCVPHKDAPVCYAVDGGVSIQGNIVPISNDKELSEAVTKAGSLLQEIQDYCGRVNRYNAKVRFPRGYLRTASSQRERLPFVKDSDLKSNLSYTIILSDTVLWLLTRTDIAATAKDMLIKLFIFLGGSLVESITKDYLKGICGKSFKVRTQYLVGNNIIGDQLKEDLDWVWDTRNIFGGIQKRIPASGF